MNPFVKKKKKQNPFVKKKVDLAPLLKNGRTVTVTWKISSAYSDRPGKFTGKVESVECGWVKIVNNKSTFHWPISVLKSVE